MDNPALATPVIVVAMAGPAVTLAENTIIKRVSAVTGIENPVNIPLKLDPASNAPVRTGNSDTKLPKTGENTLSGVVEL